MSRHPVDGHFLKKIVLYVVSPLKVRDLAVEQPSGDLQGSCASPHYSTVLLADLCRSFASCAGKSLQILASSLPSLLVCLFLGKYSVR